ncbi:MAG: hypothetical protein NXI24_03660 [bacterium]|nr:hypothetical protein [bacterium]
MRIYGRRLLISGIILALACQGLAGRPDPSDFSGELSRAYRGPWGRLPDYDTLKENLLAASGETRRGPARSWKAVQHGDTRLYVAVGPMPAVDHPSAPGNYHVGWQELIICETFACPEKDSARYLFYMARKVEGERETILYDIATDGGRSYWGLHLSYKKKRLLRMAQVWFRYRTGQPEPVRWEAVNLREEQFVVRDNLSFEGHKRIPRSESWMLHPELIPASLRQSVLSPDFPLAAPNGLRNSRAYHDAQ